MISLRCRLTVLALGALILPIPITAMGCGGSDQTTGTTAAPTEQSKKAEGNMEDFMKNKEAASKKK